MMPYNVCDVPSTDAAGALRCGRPRDHSGWHATSERRPEVRWEGTFARRAVAFNTILREWKYLNESERATLRGTLS